MSMTRPNFEKKELAISGSPYVYLPVDIPAYTVEVTHRDPIDGELLQRALDRTIQRMPYLSDTLTIEHGAVTDVTGNTCPRGEEYARKEVTNPTRVVTSVVPVDGSPTCAMASVKTAGDVPKDKVLDVIDALRPVRLQAPVRIGDVVLADVCETGVDVVATKDC
jgi:CxxC motif-containing protein